MNDENRLIRPGEDHALGITLTEQDRELAGWMQLKLDRPVAELQESVILKANLTARLRVEIGLELLAIRIQCEVGEWMRWLHSAGIDKDRAAEAIRYARFMARLEPPERSKAMSLPVKKVYALASADDEVLEEILSDDEKFNATTALNVSQMRERIKELENEKANLTVRLDTAEIQRDHALKFVEPDVRWDPGVQMVREEALHFSSVAMQALDDLEQVLVKLAVELPALMDDDERAASQFRTAAVSLYQSIAGPLGRASLLLEEFRDKYDLEEFCVDSPEHLPVLSNSEALRFFQNWQGITRIAQSEKEYRDMKRASKSRKGKPGPKPGSKRKG